MEEHIAAAPRGAGTESMFLQFLAMFASIYLVGYFVVFRGWAPRHRTEAASCFTSLFHGTPAALLALCAVLSRNNPTAGALELLAVPNSAANDLVLDFSTAYFAVDLAHYLFIHRGEALFIAHHGATLYVLATCRHAAAAGAHALLALEVLAEATSAAQNVWTLASMRRHDSRLAARLHARLSLPFYAGRVHGRQGRARAGLVRQDGELLLCVLRRGRPCAGVAVGVVDGGDGRRDSGEHSLGGQPVAGVLQGDQGKQGAREQQAAMIKSEAFRLFAGLHHVSQYLGSLSANEQPASGMAFLLISERCWVQNKLHWKNLLNTCVIPG